MAGRGRAARARWNTWYKGQGEARQRSAGALSVRVSHVPHVHSGEDGRDEGGDDDGEHGPALDEAHRAEHGGEADAYADHEHGALTIFLQAGFWFEWAS